MSLLIVSEVASPAQERLRTADAKAIAAALAIHGVTFERWPTRPVANDASPAEVLAAYAPEVDRLTRAGGYASVDVVRLAPDPSDGAWAEKAAAARGKFLQEHTHAEDEVRFFVEGAGLFALRFGGDVALVLCEAGDLLSIPRGTRHWFDMGTTPSFRALRFFGTPDGWVASFTGDDVAMAFPSFDAVRGAER